MEQQQMRGASAGAGGRAAYYARLLPRAGGAGAAPAEAAPGEEEDDVARALRRALEPESVFYRVLKESKLYALVFSAGEDGGEDAEDVVVVQEIAKHGARTSSASRGRRNSVYDPNAFSVKKMPEEVVASSGRLQCLFGAQHAVTWFIQLRHIENAYMILSMADASEPPPPRISSTSVRSGGGGGADNVVPVLSTPTTTRATVFLERVKAVPTASEDENDDDDDDDAEAAARRPDAKAFEATGRFYYRVLVPIELRKAPDLLAPVISRHVFKNAEEIIECSQLYRCPQSSVVFVKLAYEDGWLFETLNSGIRVLERLATEPQVQHGHFFYVVRIPVGIRVAPNIMAQRAGKGFKLHSVVEASQRFTPPGSKITYVRVCKDRSSRCACFQTHHQPPQPLQQQTQQQQQQQLTDTGDSDSSDGAGSDDVPAYTSCHGGWIFETTMDGQVVLEPIAKPAARQVERLFYRVLEDVDVLPTPSFPPATGGSSGSGRPPGKGQAPASPSSRRKRLGGTLIECSERLVPSSVPATATGGTAATTPPPIAFVKLRHDVGWVCERRPEAPFRLVLEQVQGFAVTRDRPTFYRVLVPVYLRSAPDFECPRLPGVAPMAVGSVFESCLQYTPPGSQITYVKVASDAAPSGGGAGGGVGTVGNGWLFDRTPGGDKVLEAVDADPEKTRGRFYYRVVAASKEVLLSPERGSEVVKYLFANTIFAAEMEYTLPRTQETYVRLAKEPGWVQLDQRSSSSTSSNNTSPRTLLRISEDLYNLYCMPPSWVSVGHPSRTWFKVPDETCRTVLAEETMLQLQIFEQRRVLATSSQGREGVALSRRGVLSLDGGAAQWPVTLEEIKHAASALLFTFPWKQVWWIFEVDGPEDKHCVELQHGLRGGFRAILLDGEVLHQTRSVTDILWDAGSEFSFTWQGHAFRVVIALEGAFFSQYLQFYSYSLLVDEEDIVPLDV
ncbi:hypothetical protein PybrP1_002710 [[Pythium] brassicae (nom. inval.)]|nr:hypothetical protein PybrP1_002710 [[Pythium] brassicae (nom. inval.)]